VTPGDKLVNLTDIDTIKVDFRLPELALTSVHAGQRIVVTVDAVPHRTFEGTIYAIDPTVDENGRAIRLRARIPNPDHVLYPGLFARVKVVVQRRENAMLIPESAIFARNQDRLVYLVVKGHAVLTKIRIGQRQPGQGEVLSGLEPDSVVITAGHQQVREGSLLDIVASQTGK